MTMTLEELGNILREEREKKGFLVEDVADRLKLSVRVIRALEEGDKTSLPHAVYIRGFVTAYGNFLELDVEELLKTDELYNDIPPSKAAFEPAITKRRGGAKIVVVFLLFCVCAAIALFIWFQRDNDLFSRLKTDHLTTAQPAPPIVTQKTPPNQALSPSGEVLVSRSQQADSTTPQSPPLAMEPQAVSLSTTSHSVASSTPPVRTPQQIPVNNVNRIIPVTSPLALGATPASPVAGDAVEQDTPTLVASSQTPTSQLQEEAQDSELRETPVPASVSLESHKVIITAVDECWIHSNADNTDTRQFSLRRGDTFALTFDESLVLKLGNAGGVRIHYDGREMPIPGKDGEVKTIKFPPAV